METMICTSIIKPDKKHETLQNLTTASNCPTATVYASKVLCDA